MSNQVHLRNLKCSDAPLMLEWMHDDDVVHFMKADFEHKTLADCEKFISSAQDSSYNLHMAVADDNDIYMGTVSLKDITSDSAEFAITMRKAAMGKGYAASGMWQILELGFNDLQLQIIYWCVSKDNHRAVKFYDKNGYNRVPLDSLAKTLNTPNSDIIARGGDSTEEVQNYLWYMVTKEEFSRKFTRKERTNN